MKGTMQNLFHDGGYSMMAVNDEVNEFHLPKSFAILRNGVLFHFQPYEMGSFAEGDMTIFLPYSEVYGLLQNNLINK